MIRVRIVAVAIAVFAPLAAAAANVPVSYLVYAQVAAPAGASAFNVRLRTSSGGPGYPTRWQIEDSATSIGVADPSFVFAAVESVAGVLNTGLSTNARHACDVRLDRMSMIVAGGNAFVPVYAISNCENLGIDGTANFGETDIDCGGATPCPRCTVGNICALNSDCTSNLCAGSVCQP